MNVGKENESSFRKATRFFLFRVLGMISVYVSCFILISGKELFKSRAFSTLLFLVLWIVSWEIVRMSYMTELEGRVRDQIERELREKKKK